MELVDGDFDDSAFPEFLAGFAADRVTGYVCEVPPSPSLDQEPAEWASLQTAIASQQQS